MAREEVKRQPKTMETYLEEIRSVLDSALNIRNFPSQKEERHDMDKTKAAKKRKLVVERDSDSDTSEDEEKHNYEVLDFSE